MKRKLLLVASLILILCCILAICLFAQECEHKETTIVSVGSNGFLDDIKLVKMCSLCGQELETESLGKMFDTLGYSHSDNGIMQHFAVDRSVVAKYEELTGEAVKFGVVTATRNHVSGNPLDSNGLPVNNKVIAVDFTSTEYAIFDVIVRGIPEERKNDTEIICCAYVIAGNNVSYLNNYAHKKDAVAVTFNTVAANLENGIIDTSDIGAYKFVDGEKYRQLTNEELGLAVGGFWNSTDANNYKYIIKNDKDSSKYAYTSMLTEDSIPVGSIITIADNWRYRPEGWVNNAKNSSRADYVTNNTVFVNDAWWGDYTTKAFNITKNPTSFVNDMTADDISEIFQIYVPASAEIPANPVPLKQAWDEDGSLKILTIGNSYSDDAMEYVYNVAKSLGIENVEVANLRANSCSLATHLSNAQNDTEYYTYRYWANGDSKWVDQGSWSSNGTYKISTAVTDADWDYIVFQQVSTSSTNASTYDDLNALIAIVEELNPTARYAWHMTWGDKTVTDLSMYNNIVSAVQSKIVGNEKIDVILPVGTTIQNLRTTDLSLDDIMRNKHLGYGIGRYAAALTFVKALTGMSIDDIKYIPTADTEGHTFAYNNVQRQTVIKAVNSAIATPFEVTEIELSEAEETIAELYALDYGTLNLIKSSYYNKNAGEYYFEPLSNEKITSTSTIYDFGRHFATKMFTKETLPVGSVIMVTGGFKYFVENWTLDENGTPIAGTGAYNSRFSATGASSNSDASAFVSTQYVIIDEKWWSDKGDIVAFNITDNSGKALNGVYAEDINNVFKLYVPQEAVAKNQAGAVDAEGKLYDPTPYNKPAYAPRTPIVNEDGLVRKDAINFEASVEINGKTYYALTFEEMGFIGGFYNNSDNTQVSLSRQTTYTAARIFTNEELLNGMYIWTNKKMKFESWVHEGEFYSYRSDDYTVKTTGGDYIEVTDEWWSQKVVSGSFVDWFTNPATQGEGPFTVRGMHLYHNGGSAAGLQDAYNYLKIYVPADMIEGYVAE